VVLASNEAEGGVKSGGTCSSSTDVALETPTRRVGRAVTAPLVLCLFALATKEYSTSNLVAIECTSVAVTVTG